jgi:G3E family GTPase
MLHNKLANIPCNLVMGFLGVGKTTAILNLLKQKPKVTIQLLKIIET